MDMASLIENSISTHLKEVKRLLTKSDRAIIVSPFISSDAINLLEKKLCRLDSLVLITTFKRSDFDQIRKIPVFRALFSICIENETDLSIRIDNHLHGKVYIGIKKGRYVGAIITSANFTHNGLQSNHEWGYCIENTDEITLLAEQILSDAEYSIEEVDITELEKTVQKLGLTDKSARPQIPPNLLDIVRPKHILVGGKRTYWLKPLGTIENPISAETKFDDGLFRMTFAKGRGSIKTGDIIISYAVKSRRILSIYTATSDDGIIKDFEDERYKRWPHYIVCENRSTQFGSNWAKINLSLDSLSDSFLNSHPKSFLHHESKTLSVFQWGLDRLRINNDFGEYIINEVFNQQGRK